MKKIYLTKVITGTLVMLASGIFSAAQCPAGSQTANVNWDNLDYLSQTGTYTAFVSTAMVQTQKFVMGRNRLTINFPGTITTVGENANNVAEAGSFGAGADVEYGGNGSITITFDTVVSNLQFSIYDIDLSQNVRVTANDPALAALAVNMTVVTAGVITVTGNGTTSALGSAANIGTLNSDNKGTLNISIAGNAPLGTTGVKRVTITTSGTVGNFWLSDLRSCVYGNFPLNYYISQKPWVGQPSYYLVTPDNNSVYMLNPLTGVAQWVFSEPISPWVNSMAYDHVNRILYYVMDNPTPLSTNKSLKKYDFNTETVSTVIPDLTAFGIPLFDMAVESAGAAFYNGSLFLGVEGTNSAKTSSRKSIIWRIDFNALQQPIQSAQVFAQLTDNGTGLLTHDWGDFTIKDGMLYDFNTGNGGSTAQFIHYNMQTGATTVFATGTNPAPIQAGQLWDGTIYWTGGQGSETGRIAKYNENGTIGVKIVATVTACSPAWVGRAGDASDPFKPKSDFGDAPATYDPIVDDKATHEYDCNLRLGATFDREWDKTSSNNATADGTDEDGISVISVLSAGSANFVQDISVYNNTGSNATLAGWLDYNGNGTFDPAEGKLLVIPSSPAIQNVNLAWIGIPVPMMPGTFTYMRIRITSASNAITESNPTKWFSNGEVEDYMVPVDFVLPVKMLSFQAAYESVNKVAVNWVTGKEMNLDGFEVEKSGDGSKWQTAAAVTSYNDNSASNSYTSFDAKPIPGKSYYRLKMLFTDGHYEYSEIRQVEWRSTNVWFKISPNPVKDNAMVQFNLDRAENVAIDVMSAGGAVVLQKTLPAVKGLNQININSLNKLSSGVYIVRLQSASVMLTTKMVIE